MKEGRQPKEALVEDIYDRVIKAPCTVKEGAKIREIIEALEKSPHARSVYVVDGEDRIKGAITTRTLMRIIGYRLGIGEDPLLLDLDWIQDADKGDIDGDFVPVVTVKRGTELREALGLMIGHDQDSIPVIDDNGRILGELVDRDLLSEYRILFNP